MNDQAKTQITGVRTVGVPVTDQDRAKDFYVGTLGFAKRLDVPYGDGGRWIEPGWARELYPDGADYARAEMWAGLRPMTPDNLPIIGRKQHRNLWYNTGHGHIGWTMSHGSARLVADLIGGKPTAIPVDGLA